MLNGWIQNNNGTWKYYKNNKPIKKNWYQVDEQWYYFNESGIMQTGWLEDPVGSGKWYYLYEVTNTKEGMTKGAMASGWIKDGSKWYYLSKTSDSSKGIYKGLMMTGWIKDSGAWYYLIENTDKPKGEYKGQMVCNCTRVIDGKSYTFDKNGVWQEQIVTLAKLKALGWKNPENSINDLNNCLRKFNITTPNRIRHFLSQCAHESGLGKYTKELATGTAYEWRRDLGNVYKGDGVKFKGAGFIQLTGRTNYQKLANYLKDNHVMDGYVYVSQVYPWTSAGYWWYINDMNRYCDAGFSCLQISSKVNRGNFNGSPSNVNGYQDRLNQYNKCCKLF